MSRPQRELCQDIEGHPAVEAWRRIRPRAPLPSSIESFKQRRGRIGRHKSYIFRLHGLRGDGGAVVAKLSRNGTAAVEIGVYRDILPKLQVPTLRLFGTLEAKEHAMTWLFTEDAGEECLSLTDEDHLRLMSAWLGKVHAGTVSLPEVERLPSHGSERYLMHLCSARKLLDFAAAGGSWSEAQSQLLARLLAQLARLEEDWFRVEAWSMERELAPALVHGDLVSKNVRVRSTKSGLELFALDWETAGRGLPAPDLAEVPLHRSPECLDSYLAEVRAVWPAITAGCIARLADIGRVFRLIASIDWAARSLRWQLDHPERPLSYLGKYDERLEEALKPVLGR